MGYCAADAVSWAEQQLVAIPGFYCEEMGNKMATQAIPPPPRGALHGRTAYLYMGLILANASQDLVNQGKKFLIDFTKKWYVLQP
jgi:hypothetical protein